MRIPTCQSSQAGGVAISCLPLAENYALLVFFDAYIVVIFRNAQHIEQNTSFVPLIVFTGALKMFSLAGGTFGDISGDVPERDAFR